MARKLALSKGMTHIPFDGIVYAFQEAHPEFGIAHLSGHDWDVCSRVQPFLFNQLQWMHDYDIPVVLDTFHIRPEAVLALGKKIPLRAVFFGYPKDTVEERLIMIRANEKPSDWTKDWDDAAISRYLKGFIQASVDLENMCATAGLPFFDVSHNSEVGYEQAYRILAGGD
jgi:hypothetical protein